MAIALLVVLIITIGIFVFAVHPRSEQENRTVVAWSYYVVPSGPSDTDNQNVTLISGWHFCPPTTAYTPAPFSMVWVAAPVIDVEQVRLWTLEPPSQGSPRGQFVILYLATNASGGGTSFVTVIGGFCELNWILDVESNVTVQVGVTADLAFNVTTSSTVYW